MNESESSRRVLSGMRPTGALHLGHYHGVVRNWLSLQHEHQCFFFVADYHALTTHYEDHRDLEQLGVEMVIDWLGAGVLPGTSTLFVQSQVPEHAELHVLLSMITPLSWLERVPSYKDQQASLADRDLATYGFLGYPMLQSADILIYRAGKVPVGGDQVAHVELTREVARRFNHLFGREPGFEQLAQAAIPKLGRRAAARYVEYRRAYLERGDAEALARARALVHATADLSLADRERLAGHLEGTGRTILPEPQALLTETPRLPGVDGEKMSKSLNNTIGLRDDADTVAAKLRGMKTDPARVRRTDPGDPDRCPVYDLHRLHSDAATLAWAADGCRSAGIGCVDCKKRLCDALVAWQRPIRERARPYEENPELVRATLAEGADRARSVARATLDEVRQAVGLARR
jgi:tryptophanyl-tRNA synthetase